MSSFRTFIAVDLGGEVCSRLTALVRKFSRAGADVKWVDTTQMHLTLKFLGNVEEQLINDVCKAVEEGLAGCEPFAITCRACGAFPDLRRPRTLWVGVDTGHVELIALQEKVESALNQLGYPRERRSFHPHVTIGRARGGRGGMDELAGLLAEHADYEAGLAAIDSVAVYSSELTRSGPIYSELSRVEL